MIPKFRARDKKTKSMRMVLVIDWLNRLVDLECGIIERKFDEVVLMQSTGMKDKNGVEIFEGDICECVDGLENYWYVIEWIYAGWQVVTYKKNTRMFVEFPTGSIKVIWSLITVRNWK